MKRRQKRAAKEAESDASDGPPLLSIFLSARQQADLHLAPFEVEGEAVPEVVDDRAD